MKFKNFLYKCLDKIKNNRVVIIISLFISVIIFSILGIWYTEEDKALYNLYLIMSELCFTGCVILFFRDADKIDKFTRSLFYFIIKLVISVFTISFWLLIFEGEKSDLYLYIPFAILIPIVLVFLLNGIKSIFRIGINIGNKFLKKKDIRGKEINFKSITSALITITGFLTALLSLIKLFEQFLKELFHF